VRITALVFSFLARQALPNQNAKAAILAALQSQRAVLPIPRRSLMARTLILCALLLALTLPCRAGDEPAPKRTLISMSVHPAPAPKPVLRYQLLPELKELSTGNPVQGYLKCFMNQNKFFYSKAASADREKWAKMPLKDLPVKDLRDYGTFALRQADEAARLDRPDWQVLPKVRKDGIRTIFPDIVPMRLLAAALKVRFRAEVAERRFDDALRTARTMFALARHLQELPTVIGNLVGVSIVYTTLGPLEEMLQQPGCPNLYWALTDLPRPLVGMRKGLQGDALAVESEFVVFSASTLLDEAGLARATEQVQGLVRLLHMLQEGPAPKKAKIDVRAWLAKRGKDAAYVRAARKRLAATGLDEARLKKMPAAQLILLDEKRAYQEQHDQGAKWLALPYWRAEPLRKMEKGDAGTLFAFMLANFVKIHRAQARLAQRIALLRHVEAIRLYAAANAGKLPARLADVRVPLPVDPFTGKPFLYEVDGNKAIVIGSPPAGEEKNAIFNVRYEVTVVK
jgi:hypothetical protein